MRPPSGDGGYGDGGYGDGGYGDGGYGNGGYGNGGYDSVSQSVSENSRDLSAPMRPHPFKL